MEQSDNRGPTAAASRRNLLVFELAQQRFAIPVSDVREVLPRASLTPLADGPAALAGILRLRGALLPVMDLRRRLGLPPVEPEVGHCIVVTASGPVGVGILVDAVDGLISDDDPVPDDAPEPHSGLVARVIESTGGVVTVLNTEVVVGNHAGALGLVQAPAAAALGGRGA